LIVRTNQIAKSHFASTKPNLNIGATKGKVSISTGYGTGKFGEVYSLLFSSSN